jgi:hypothetical protein
MMLNWNGIKTRAAKFVIDWQNIITNTKEKAEAQTLLDRTVEKTYGKKFSDDSERVAFLFEIYKGLAKDLFSEKDKKKRKKADK